MFLYNLSIYLSIYLSVALQPFWTVADFQFLSPYTVGRSPWTGDQPVTRPPPTHRTKQTQNKRAQTSMPRVGFEPIIPAFERAKTVNALDGAATMIGRSVFQGNEIQLSHVKFAFHLSSRSIISKQTAHMNPALDSYS
jgi:hypothetical protein